jgi:protein gp37
MNKTKITWCDYTWNPIVGCSPASEGCQNCYAAAISKRFHLHWGTPHFMPERLSEPARVKKGGRVFVCSMSDLGHKDVEPKWRLAILMMMLANQQHTYIVLTKRPGPWLNMFAPIAWIGVTIENQEQAEKRLPPLIATHPRALRFVSVEPMLGPVDLRRVRFPTGCLENLLDPQISDWGRKHVGMPNCIDWVIAGPETGPKARPYPRDAFHDLRFQCQEAGIPFFDKRNDGIPRREFPCNARLARQEEAR